MLLRSGSLAGVESRAPSFPRLDGTNPARALLTSSLWGVSSMRPQGPSAKNAPAVMPSAFFLIKVYPFYFRAPSHQGAFSSRYTLSTFIPLKSRQIAHTNTPTHARTHVRVPPPTICQGSCCFAPCFAPMHLSGTRLFLASTSRTLKQIRREPVRFFSFPLSIT